jgi:hypothetical protein
MDQIVQIKIGNNFVNVSMPKNFLATLGITEDDVNLKNAIVNALLGNEEMPTEPVIINGQEIAIEVEPLIKISHN